MTQLQKVNADVQETVKELGLPDQEQMIHALKQVDQHADVLSAAGFDIEKLDMRLAYPLQLDVHLRRNLNKTSPDHLENLRLSLETGELHFYRDVYGRDAAVLTALDAIAPRR